MKRCRLDSRRRGTILIVTMVLCFTLASVVLVLCHSMSVEAIASANDAAAVQADAVERGAEQYILGLMVTAQTASGNNTVYALQDTDTYDDSYWNGVQVGRGYFWVIRPDYGDAWMPPYGLVDEGSKLDLNNLNLVGVSELELLPGMTSDLAAALLDWRSSEVNTGGAKDEYYLSLPSPYPCKQALYETLDETLMVRGMSKAILYGAAGATPLGQVSAADTFGTGGALSDGGLPAHGLADYLTVNAKGPTRQQDHFVNLATAPRAVLACVRGLADTDVDNIVSARTSSGSFGANVNNRNGLPPEALRLLAPQNPQAALVSSTYSADILAVSGNGRAFRRVKIIIDTSTDSTSISTVPRIIYRRDFTQGGWPLDPAILDSIRAGTYQSTGIAYADATSGGQGH